jgi:hypothetical protein
MEKLLLAAAVTIGALIATPTYATDWWVLDPANDKCMSASIVHDPDYTSPYDLGVSFLHHGVYAATDVQHGVDGSILAVEVRRTNNTSVYFFPNKQYCESSRHMLYATPMNSNRGSLTSLLH